MAKWFRWGTLIVVVLTAFSLHGAALAASGWTVASTPGTSTNAILNGAFVRTESDVWAVGTAFGNAGATPPPPVAYHWNGTTWSVVPTADLSGTGAGLMAVSASSATDAWAVGFGRLSGYGRSASVYEHWNGSTWSLVSGANAGGLVGVATLSASNAWAVSTKGTLVHWDGTAWTMSTTPQPNPANTFGNRVSAMSADGAADIWAVGTYTTPSYTDVPYALHFNGTSWSVVAMADPASGTPRMTGVSVLSPSNVWAVGQTGGAAIAEHWDGHTWTMLPAVPGQYPSLNAVVARAANDVWVFGSQATGTQNLLLVHWDGTSWSTASAPTNGQVNGAAALPGGSHIWAVGVGANNQPQILSHP